MYSEFRRENFQAALDVRNRSSAAHRAAQFELHHFFLLAAVAALLIGVFWLSTASRTGWGFYTGSHLRSLARAHRVAENDHHAIPVAQISARVTAISLPEPRHFGHLLPIERGARKAVASLSGPRVSRAPPPIAV